MVGEILGIYAALQEFEYSRVPLILGEFNADHRLIDAAISDPVGTDAILGFLRRFAHSVLCRSYRRSILTRQ